jgi:hypothetical protein
MEARLTGRTMEDLPEAATRFRHVGMKTGISFDRFNETGGNMQGQSPLSHPEKYR